jgi:hypothetical protein
MAQSIVLSTPMVLKLLVPAAHLDYSCLSRRTGIIQQNQNVLHAWFEKSKRKVVEMHVITARVSVDL